MLLLPFLLAPALAEPTSLRGATSGQLFRDDLDLAAQPAAFADHDGDDVYTWLAFRSPQAAAAAGAVVDAGPTRLLVYADWSRYRHLAWTVADPEVEDSVDALEGRIQDAWSADVDLAGEVGRVGLGGGVSFQGAFTRVPLGWDGIQDGFTAQAPADGLAPDFLASDRSWSVRGRLGAAWDEPGGPIDLHVYLGREQDVVEVYGRGPAGTVEGYAPAGFVEDVVAAGTNTRTWRPGLVVDKLRRVGERDAFRGFLDLSVGAVSPGIPERSEIEADGDTLRQRLVDPLHLDVRLHALLLGHVVRGPLEVRVGGRIRTTYVHRERLELTKIGRADTVARGTLVDDAGLTVSVPLALEARVHPRVVLRAAAEPAFFLDVDRVAGGGDRDGDERVDADGGSDVDLGDGAAASGTLGVRWDALDVLSVEAAIGAGGTWEDAGGWVEPKVLVSLVFHP